MDIDWANAHYVNLSLYAMKESAVSSGSGQRIITQGTFENRVTESNIMRHIRRQCFVR